jgi:hypothetical protein
MSTIDMPSMPCATFGTTKVLVPKGSIALFFILMTATFLWRLNRSEGEGAQRSRAEPTSQNLIFQINHRQSMDELFIAKYAIFGRETALVRKAHIVNLSMITLLICR